MGLLSFIVPSTWCLDTEVIPASKLKSKPLQALWAHVIGPKEMEVGHGGDACLGIAPAPRFSWIPYFPPLDGVENPPEHPCRGSRNVVPCPRPDLVLWAQRKVTLGDRCVAEGGPRLSPYPRGWRPRQGWGRRGGRVPPRRTSRPPRSPAGRSVPLPSSSARDLGDKAECQGEHHTPSQPGLYLPPGENISDIISVMSLGAGTALCCPGVDPRGFTESQNGRGWKGPLWVI